MSEQEIIQKGDTVYLDGGYHHPYETIEALEVIDILLDPTEKILLLKRQEGDHVLVRYDRVTKDSRKYDTYQKKLKLKKKIEELEEELEKMEA